MFEKNNLIILKSKETISATNHSSRVRRSLPKKNIKHVHHGGIDAWSTSWIYLWTSVVLNEISTNTIFSLLKNALSNVIFKTSHT